MSERDPSLHILQHALGLDDGGLGKMYRNHFVTGPQCDNWNLCEAHVAAGRMEKHAPREIFGGNDMHCFTVTEAGIAFVRSNSPKPKKLTRDQKRYQTFMSEREVNPDLEFGDFVKRPRRAVAHV